MHMVCSLSILGHWPLQAIICCENSVYLKSTTQPLTPSESQCAALPPLKLDDVRQNKPVNCLL